MADGLKIGFIKGKTNNLLFKSIGEADTVIVHYSSLIIRQIDFFDRLVAGIARPF